uniref:RRM domain-containing protein n=1 Tax=Loxodonta africana TaxID=9785 RepID=G3U3U0_LOXAF
MAASAKKKSKKSTSVCVNLDFLAEDGGSGGSIYVPIPVSWAGETDYLEGDVSTSWHSNDDDVYRVPPIDTILPSAPWVAQEPNIDRSRLPKLLPYTAFLGNLPYDVTEDTTKEFCRGLNISAVYSPHEPSNPERLKGFDYAELEDLNSRLSAISLDVECLRKGRIQVAVANSTGKDRNNHSFCQDRNQDSDQTDTHCRACSVTDSFDDYPPRRGTDSFGDKYHDPYVSDQYFAGCGDGHHNGRCWDMDRYGDWYRRGYDRGSDSRIGSGRRAFGSGY